MNKIFIILLIGLIAFAAVFVKGFFERKEIKSEKPIYRSVLNINIDYDFLDTSILGVFKTVFNEDAFSKLGEYEQLEMSGKDILERVYYNAESKRNVYVTVYSFDKETGIRTLNGIIVLMIPMISSEIDSEAIDYNFVERNNRVKIKDFSPVKDKGLVEIGDYKIVSWEEYTSTTSMKSVIKNCLVVSFYSMFLTIIILILYRFFSKRIFSIQDVRNLTGLEVIAVSDDKYDGIDFIEERIKAGFHHVDKKIGLIPVSDTDALNNTVNRLFFKGEDLFSVIDSMSKSYEILKEVNRCNSIIIIFEFEKTTSEQLCNTLELIEDISNCEIGIVGVGLKRKSIERNGEYFGKFYPNY